VAHKPAQVFIFSRDVYDRTKSEKLDFSIWYIWYFIGSVS
jgi:hypothetical protein